MPEQRHTHTHTHHTPHTQRRGSVWTVSIIIIRRQLYTKQNQEDGVNTRQKHARPLCATASPCCCCHVSLWIASPHPPPRPAPPPPPHLRRNPPPPSPEVQPPRETSVHAQAQERRTASWYFQPSQPPRIITPGLKNKQTNNSFSLSPRNSAHKSSNHKFSTKHKQPNGNKEDIGSYASHCRHTDTALSPSTRLVLGQAVTAQKLVS